MGRARARRSARDGAVPRRHRHERQDDDDRDARELSACRRHRRRCVRQHRVPLHDGGARAGSRGARGRGLVVPARAAASVPPADLGAAEPRARSPRSSRLARRVPSREGVGVRAATRRRRPCRKPTTTRRRRAVSATAPCTRRWFRAGDARRRRRSGYVDGVSSSCASSTARRRRSGAIDDARAGLPRADAAAAAAAALAFGVAARGRRRRARDVRPARAPRRRGRRGRRRPLPRQLEGDERACGARRDRGGRRRGADRRWACEGPGPRAAARRRGAPPRGRRHRRGGRRRSSACSAATSSSSGRHRSRMRPGAPSRWQRDRAPSCSRPRARAGISSRRYAERGDRFAAAARSLAREVAADG